MRLSKTILPALGACLSVAKGTQTQAVETGINYAHSIHLPINGDFFDSAKNFAKIIPQTSKGPIWGPLPETHGTFTHRSKVGTPTDLLPEAEQLHKLDVERDFVRQQREQANRYIDQYGYEQYLQACESVTYYVRETLKPPKQKEKFEKVVQELASPFNATSHRSKMVMPAIPAEAKKLLNIPKRKRTIEQQKRLEELGYEMIHPHGKAVSASSREEKANTFMEKVIPFKPSKYTLKPNPQSPPIVFSRDVCPLPELRWGTGKRLSRYLPSFDEFGDPPSLTHYEVNHESELLFSPKCNSYEPTDVTTLNDGTSIVTMMVSGKPC